MPVRPHIRAPVRLRHTIRLPRPIPFAVLVLLVFLRHGSLARQPASPHPPYRQNPLLDYFGARVLSSFPSLDSASGLPITTTACVSNVTNKVRRAVHPPI